MFSSNLTKFFVLSALIFSLFSGCRFLSNPNDANSSAPPVADDLKSEVPFSTKEPEQFQAEMVVTAGETERKNFIARRGDLRRYDFNSGAKTQLTVLQTDKNYLLLPAKKIYAETSAGEAAAGNEWTDFLTTEWLSQKIDAKFEKLETAGDLTKYRILFGDRPGSEVLLYVDETRGLPVKQEFYSIGETPKTLVYSFELKNLKQEAEESLFSMPPDFKLVSAEELRKVQRSELQK